MEIDKFHPTAIRLGNLEIENKKLREALQFYADGKHYSCWCNDEWLDPEDDLRHEHDWEFEDGSIAREALDG